MVFDKTLAAGPFDLDDTITDGSPSRDAGEGQRPRHHGLDGRFRNPWEAEEPRGLPALLRWAAERIRAGGLPPLPPSMPRAEPDVAYPRAAFDEIRITWVGHSSFLIQIGGLNVLTDPVWSQRASPTQSAGPRRFTAPGLSLDRIPDPDLVLITHDHYDHLDRPTVRKLVGRYGSRLTWLTPLGFRGWFARAGAPDAVELDWWESRTVQCHEQQEDTAHRASIEAIALPARHWTRRTPLMMNRRLWCSWALRTVEGRSVYFGGDSGYSVAFAEIGRRLGPFDACLLPIGTYEPRWFMRPMHINPEEAVRVYRDLGARGAFVGMHWGTFQLTDEVPLEPPVRTRAAWVEAEFDSALLNIPAHGETIVL